MAFGCGSGSGNAHFSLTIGSGGAAAAAAGTGGSDATGATGGDPASAGMSSSTGGAASGGAATGGAVNGGAGNSGAAGRGKGGKAGVGGASAGSGATSAAGGGDGPPPQPTVADCSALPQPGVWENVTPPLPTADANTAVVQVDPLNAGTLYTQQHTGGNGTHASSDGLRVSHDCGATWEDVPGGRNATDASGDQNIHNGTLVSLVIDPYDSQTIYTVSNYGPGGVWRSSNGGTDWDQLVTGDVAQYVTGLWFNGLSMDPTNHKHLVAVTHAGCTGDYAPNCIAETRDAGATWTLTKLPHDWAEGNGMFIIDDQTMIWETGQDGLYVTKDAGKDWSNVSMGANGAGMGNYAYKASDGYYYLASVYGMLRSKPTDLMNWENVQTGQFMNMVGTGKNMVASNYFALTFWSASESDPTKWTQMPTPTDAMQQYKSQPDSPTTGGYYMAYDESHHVVYVSNFWVILRTVVP